MLSRDFPIKGLSYYAIPISLVSLLFSLGSLLTLKMKCTSLFSFWYGVCDPLGENSPFFAIFKFLYAIAMKYNGRIVHVPQKFIRCFNLLGINQTKQCSNQQYYTSLAPQLIWCMKIFVWCP